MVVWCCCRVVVVLWIVWYLVGWVVDRLRGWGNEKTLAWALPNEKLPFFNRILTSVPIPDIQETVYLILVFQIV